MKEKKENTLDNWEKLRRGEQSADAVESLSTIWEASTAYGQDFQPDVEVGLKRLKHRIQADDTPIVSLSSRLSSLRSIAAAAILALVSTAALYLYLNHDTQVVAWTTIATAANETREVILPDGSSIQLNHDTRLSYRTDLNTAEQRSIELEGEAFFDVKRRTSQPFIIRTARAEVKVLGTSFNVLAQAGSERTEVEVSTGKVAVRGLAAGEETVILEATDAVVVEDHYQLYLDNDSPLNSDAWRTGELSFRAVDLATALSVIERTYMVDFHWDTAVLQDCTITGNWSTERFSDVLLLLEGLTGMKIEAVGKDTYQLSGSCQ